MKKTTIAIKVCICLAFFGVLLSFIQANELRQMFNQINWFYFTLSFLLVPIMLSASCLKWKLLLDAKGKTVPFLTLIRIYLIGSFFSNLLPSSVGGDVARSFYAGKLIDNQAYSAVSIFVERFSGGILLLILVILAPLMHPSLYRSPYVFIPALAAFCILLVIFWVWKSTDPFRMPDKIIGSLFTLMHRGAEQSGLSLLVRMVDRLQSIYFLVRSKLKKVRHELNHALDALRHNRLLLVKVVLLTVLYYLLTWLNVYVSYLAFNVHPSFTAASALVPAVMFAGNLPITFLGNLGFMESVLVFYFMLIQIPAASTLAMGLLLRLKILSLGLVGLVVYLFYRQTHKEDQKQFEQFRKNRQAVNE